MTWRLNQYPGLFRTSLTISYQVQANVKGIAKGFY